MLKDLIIHNIFDCNIYGQPIKVTYDFVPMPADKFEEMFKFNGQDLDEFFVPMDNDEPAKPKEKVPCNCPIHILMAGGCQKKEEHY